MKFEIFADEALRKGIERFCDFFGAEIGKGGRKITAKQVEKGLLVEGKGEEITLCYSKKHLFFYGLSFCIQNYDKENFSVSRENADMRMGIMRDCARNASLSVAGAKLLLTVFASLGYEYLEMYVEDLMEIEAYPYLGLHRGRYTAAEFRELDEFAQGYGMELVPCIQTLAHLPFAFRHDAFAAINDTDDILLIDEPKTYEFIEAMVKFCAENFTSRKINIGMDEAHNMCRGKYLDRNGFEADRGDAFLRHLYKVRDICRKYGFAPSMWSDMIFKVGLDIHVRQAYIGHEEKHFTEEFKKKIPQDVTCVFWDYYHDKQEFYDGVFEKHFELTDNVAFAGGATSWMGFAAANGWAERALGAAIASCKKYGCQDFMVTVWGDGGGECPTLATLSTLLWSAENLLGGEYSEAALNERAERLFGNTYTELKGLENLNRTAIDSIQEGYKVGKVQNPSKYHLYNDVLVGVLDAHAYDELEIDFARNAEEFSLAEKKGGKFSHLFAFSRALSHCLAIKATLGLKITRAYREGNKQALRTFAQEDIPETIKRVEEFYEAYRTTWHKENKSIGFEVTDIRIGAVLQRLKESARIIEGYLEGSLSKIEALESARIPVCTFMKEGEDICYNHFPWNITGSLL